MPFNARLRISKMTLPPYKAISDTKEILPKAAIFQNGCEALLKFK